MTSKPRSEQITMEPDQDYFPSLTPKDLVEMKKLWMKLNSIILSRPSRSDSDQQNNPNINQKDQPSTPSSALQSLSSLSLSEDTKFVESIIREESEVEAFRDSFWDWIMMDDPDMMICKFLRARKFKVNESLKMLLNCLRWRIDRKVDQIDETEEVKLQLLTGKAFVNGFDRRGCPIFRINASKHQSSAQSPRAVEDFVIYSIESIRLFMIPPNETATILVDLGGFGTSNMDWKCTSFMTKILEAYYPESLNTSIIYRAPWIFSGIWKIIQSMLDPVVKEKVIFPKNEQELQKLIDESNLLRSEAGKSEFEWSYEDPDVKISDKKRSDKNKEEEEEEEKKGKERFKEERERLKSKEISIRSKLIEIFNELNLNWLKLQSDRLNKFEKSKDLNNGNGKVDESDEDENQDDDDDDRGFDKDRLIRVVRFRALVKLMLKAHYFKLLPLIKNESIYYRHKNLSYKEPGIVKFYSKKKEIKKDENDNNSGSSMDDEDGVISLGEKTGRKNLLVKIREEFESIKNDHLKRYKAGNNDDEEEEEKRILELIEKIDLDEI